MQNLSTEKLKELSDKWLRGAITPEELEQLEGWYNQHPQGDLRWQAGDADEEQLRERLLYNITEMQKAEAQVLRPLYKKPLVYQMAAALILAFGVVFYYLPATRNKQIVNEEFQTKVNAPVSNPNQAILTLANGKKLILNKSGNGLIAKQGHTEIKKTQDGKLLYANTDAAADAKPEINMISTPAGGSYQITLPDGSKVWINALTELKFPTAFSGKERVVELNGEAYFEVAKNKAMPFKVKMTNNTSVQVLGTHFNIMAYDNERSINATLLEGSINIRKGNQSKLMVPGQQATVTDEINLKEVNADESIAWINGLFSFDKTDIHTVLRQIERWYSVTIEYEAKVPDHQITGYISRSSNLPEVVKMLELSGVKLKIEGKKIKIFNN
ncbi:FecR family protein [Mucilaginibacter ximonensis]|uniref:FecR family protein n=1 Tax=Mucilaginibacter ximonensis TaxID=538021 RepID=A0ABW5Y9L1_9SPHI